MPWVEIVKKSKHQCSPPGWLARRKEGALEGSQWHCHVCGQMWTWTTYQPPSGGTPFPHWAREVPRPPVAHKQPPGPPPRPRSQSDLIRGIATLCDWSNPAFDTRGTSHAEFHHGSPCPYEEVVPAFLRGEPDPRRRRLSDPLSGSHDYEH